MQVTLDDLGVQARGDLYMGGRIGRDPRSGRAVALVTLGVSGFLVVDPVQRAAYQVRAARTLINGCWEAIGQASDGAVYLSGVFNIREPLPLLRWNWEGRTADPVAALPCRSLFCLDVAPDGTVYLPDYSQNTLYAYRPAADRTDNLGAFTPFGDHIQYVHCAPDGFVYVTCTDYIQTVVVALDPRTAERRVVRDADGRPCAGGSLVKDGAGQVLVAARHWGRAVWFVLKNGAPAAIPQTEVVLSESGGLAFPDGGYIRRLDPRQVHYVAPDGQALTFDIEREDSPLRIFSLARGGDRLWGSTFMPLTLFSYDPASARAAQYENPTRQSGGEIYSLEYARDKLFLASYNDAVLTRYAPDRPWRRDGAIADNPAHLGLMKETGKPLQRPQGHAQDDQGRIFFSAMGGYGCPDSGLCRIEPDTETVTRRLYPNTTFGPLVYLPARRQLLVGERRDGEDALRLTFLDPDDGHEIASLPLIRDQGAITSWLTDGGDWVYGLHDHRATLFAFSLSEQRIVATRPEMGLGDNCYNMLLFGPDDRIWGLTVQCVFAVTRDLSRHDVVARYPDHAYGSANRFGMVYGPDGWIYFPNGTHLMRVRW